MAPTSRIYLTRHAQGTHNLKPDYDIPDAHLTPVGREQAASLAHLIPDVQDAVSLIVTSPLTRTLQTTLLGYAPAVARLGKASIICLPEAQECNDQPCNTGASRAALESNPEFAGLDFSRLTPDWNSKAGIWAADPVSVATRARNVRHFLRDRPEKDIVLVGHGDILRQIETTEAGPGTHMWREAEVRVCTFDPESVGTEECFLRLEEVVEAARGYEPIWHSRGVHQRLWSWISRMVWGGA